MQVFLPQMSLHLTSTTFLAKAKNKFLIAQNSLIIWKAKVRRIQSIARTQTGYRKKKQIENEVKIYMYF